MKPYDCAERIRLIEEYSRTVTDFHRRVESFKTVDGEWNEADWNATEAVHADSEMAWEALDRHLREHQCLAPAPTPATDAVDDHILEKAALSALDIIVVANDDRRYVDVNQAAADVLGLSRDEIVGRRIDEFFSEAAADAAPAAWEDFVAEGVRCGICELNLPGRRRRFEYRAKANFAPGLHLSVMREVREEGDR